MRISMSCVSALVDRKLAVRAVGMALPLIEAAMADPELNDNRFLYLVVMDPAVRPRQCTGDAAFQQAILYEHSVGDSTQWDADYATFARAKARAGWISGCDAYADQSAQPYLLQADDFKLLRGNSLDHIVVGVSGMRPCYDEAIASVIAACMKALALDGAQRRKG